MHTYTTFAPKQNPIPKHAVDLSALLAEGMQFTLKKNKDFTIEKLQQEIKQKMTEFKSPSLEELKKNATYVRVFESKNESNLVVGSGPILDSYKALHESLRKEDKTHTWPEAYHPELTGEKYDRNGNIAFIYAGIAKKQSFEIVIPLDLLLKRAAQEIYLRDVGGAFVEVVWLLRNGYDLRVSEKGELIAQFARECQTELPTMTQKFFHLDEATKEMEKIAAIWQKFSDEEINRLRKHWATKLVENSKYFSAEKIKSKAEISQHLSEADSILQTKQKTFTVA